MKPERDPEMCSRCDSEAEVPTPEGPMCQECADELAEVYNADEG